MKDYGLDILSEKERDIVAATPETGFLADFGEWAGLKTDAPAYSVQAAGLMALSLAAGDVVVLPGLFGDTPVHMNLYIMLVGPSTVMRKTTVLNMVRGLLPVNVQTGDDIVTILDDVSIQAFNRALAESGSRMSPVVLNTDEVAGLFQQVRNRSGSYLTGFDKTLMRAFDHSPIEIARVGQATSAPRGAFVNVFAASTPEPLLEVLDSDDVESGLLPRFIIFDVRDAERGVRRSLLERRHNDETYLAKKEELKERLLDIAQERAAGIPIAMNAEKGWVSYETTTLDIEQDALERLDVLDAKITKEAGTDATSIGAIKGRAFWHIYKLSGLYALSRGGVEAKVEMIDVLRAMFLVESTMSDLVRMRDEVGANKLERWVNEVIEILRGTRGRTARQSAIARQLRVSVRDLADIRNTLKVRDLIAIHEDEANGVTWELRA